MIKIESTQSTSTHLDSNFPFQIFETIGKENIKLNPKQVDELLDLISKEEYLENEEKIQKALEKSKEEREQREQEKHQNKSAAAEEEALEKADDQKHIMDAEKTPTFESTVSRIAPISHTIYTFWLCIHSNCFSHFFLRGSIWNRQSSESLQKKISDLDLSDKSTSSPKKPTV